MLGMLGTYVEIVVRVPRRDLERAKELHALLRRAPEQTSGEGTDEPGAPSAAASPPAADHAPPAAGDDEAPPRSDRLGRVAAFAALTLTFGAGHWYARRRRVAALLLVLEIACIGVSFAFPVLWYAVLGIVLADVLGSTSWIAAERAGAPAPPMGRAAPLIAVAAIALIPAWRWLAPASFAGGAASRACELAAACGGELSGACVDRAAQRTLEGRQGHDAACADCLEGVGCEDAAAECGICYGLVRLPASPSPAPSPLRLRLRPDLAFPY